MKKASINKKSVFCIFFFFFCFLFFSCGLDVIEVIDPPTDGGYNPPTIEYNDDYASFVLRFATNEANSSSYNVNFIGTDVMYKIYSSESTLIEERNRINNLILDDENNANLFEKYLENKFVSLKCSAHNEEVLIPKSNNNKNQEVYIRLSDNTNEFPAKITVDNKSLASNNELTIPYRNIDGKEGITFNFSKYSEDPEHNRIPEQGDSDVVGSSSDDGVWYVLLYAVSKANDSSYNPVYSNLLYLGDVKIRE